MRPNRHQKKGKVQSYLACPIKDDSHTIRVMTRIIAFESLTIEN